jgi:neutral ceramidase
MMLAVFFYFATVLALVANAYKAGVGIYDMTGPSVEVNFMGYANPGQRGEGIHMRLRARSFAVSEDDGSKMVIYVNVDGGMASDLVTMKVVEEVNKELGENTISADNLAISGTHTHSGPAGYLQYFLFQVTSLGYVSETLQAWIMGISNSVIMAINDLKPANIKIANGKLYDTNINRSPTSYLLNPQEERDQYEDGDTDKNMMLLKFVSEETQEPIGILNWFSVHGTSMNNTNKLVSSDNKGYAAYKLEKDVNGPSSMPGMGPFVAGFSSTNLGDVSPNTAGPKCIDTGLPCDGSNSTCNGRCEKCIAFGPGKNGDMVESTQIIGNNQYEFAKKLTDTATEEISGPVDFRHSFVKMDELVVTLASGEKKTLCSPAMGYAFAAGTTDGPGMFDFTQGTTSSNRLWNLVGGIVSEPSEEEKECQAPKPILLNTGAFSKLKSLAYFSRFTSLFIPVKCMFDDVSVCVCVCLCLCSRRRL